LNKQDTIKSINELLNTSDEIHRDEEIIALYDKIIQLASEADIEAYKLCFEGYKANLKKEYDKAETSFNKSISIDDKLIYPLIGLGNMYFEKEEYDKAISNYKKAVNIDDKNAVLKYNLGLVYTKKNEYSEAIKYFGEAIDIGDKIDYKWIYLDLGNAYSEVNNLDEAIKYYRKAIELDEKFSYPWYGLGNIYWYAYNNYSKAIQYFEKAMMFDAFSHPLNIEANVYFEKSAYGEAIKYYNEAIELDATNPDHFFYSGLIHMMNGNYDEAIDSLNSANKIYKEKNNNCEIQRIEDLIGKIKNLKISADSVKLLAQKNDRIGIILESTKLIFQKSEKNKKEFLNFLKEDKNLPDIDDYYIEVLRRWNSYTPIVADDYHISKGGGYFIRAGGFGIVIDPGFNFIENFKGAGHIFYEIDVVIISHAHNDHAADLESILTLLYKYNDDIKKSDDPDNKNTIYRILKNKRAENPDNTEITDKEIDDEFEKSGRRKMVDIFMPQSVFKKYGGLFELFKRVDYRIHIIEKGRTGIELCSGCKLKMDVLGAKHFDIISDFSSVGMVLHTEKSAIVYTGDTGWNIEIENEYKQVYTNIKDKKSVLIAHLGGFKEYENDYAKYFLAEDSIGMGNSYYKNHLGRIGVAKVTDIVKPELCLISEFGEEFKRHRQEITEIYNKVFNNNPKFLPADIGLVYHLEDSTDDKKNKIKAISKIKIDNYKMPSLKDKYTFEFKDKDKIKTILLWEDCSLHYYSEGCVKPEELIQILQKEYRDSIK